MQVNLRLLEEKHCGFRFVERLDKHGQDLTNAVTNVKKVNFFLLTRELHSQLKRSRFTLGESAHKEIFE